MEMSSTTLAPSTYDVKTDQHSSVHSRRLPAAHPSRSSAVRVKTRALLLPSPERKNSVSPRVLHRRSELLLSLEPIVAACTFSRPLEWNFRILVPEYKLGLMKSRGMDRGKLEPSIPIPLGALEYVIVRRIRGA